MIDKDIVMWLLGGLIVIIGWFSSRKISDLEKADATHTAEIAALKESKADLKLHISENYIKGTDVKEFMKEIRDELGKIYSKIEAKEK